jgi:CO dehydrogenase/acetyl-CoA synthase beta subunit
MELYNSLIRSVKEILPDNPKEYSYIESACWADNGSSELVLQKDAAYELGASGRGSANLVLYTSSDELVNEDKVIVYGKELGEIKADCDFARIVLLRIGMIDAEDEVIYRTLKDIEFAKYHVYPAGYMVRMSPESYREQVRVSRSAIKNGISFRALGNNYIREYKKDINVLSAQVIFITDPDVNYEELKKLAKKANDVTGTLTHILEGLSTDCSVCQLKDICDEVDGMKELHFGVGDKGKH